VLKLIPATATTARITVIATFLALEDMVDLLGQTRCTLTYCKFLARGSMVCKSLKIKNKEVIAGFAL
jgi:hypothetical protein